LVVREHENDGIAAPLVLDEETVREKSRNQGVGAESVEQGPENQLYINRILERDSEKDIKNKTMNLSAMESGCGPKN
jgi:hypothetical protein